MPLNQGGIEVNMDSLNFKTISYDKNKVKITESTNLSEFKKSEGICWVDVPDLSDKEGIKALCKAGKIHRLIVEDILNTNQMVKMDNYDDCLFIVLKMLDFNRGESNIITEHISIAVRAGCVFSFQENSGDIFSRVREKIKSGKDNIRSLDAGYLCYELVDTVVDDYFNTIEELEDIVDTIEEELITKPDKSTLSEIYFIKRKLMYLRKSVYPLREVIGNLLSSPTNLVDSNTKIYFHDVFDHLIQIVDSIETYQDILSNMLDTYLSSVGNRTNDTMKILTIFSTIFIPLTYLAGIYGMNFKNIPELSLDFGYALFWVVSIVIAGLMLLFFHHKKWF